MHEERVGALSDHLRAKLLNSPRGSRRSCWAATPLPTPQARLQRGFHEIMEALAATGEEIASEFESPARESGFAAATGR
jgi:hypothetical protein